MPEATTTTIDHGAILLRQVGNGFYLTPAGVFLLLGAWLGLVLVIVVIVTMEKTNR